jgi:hypothetical protein
VQVASTPIERGDGFLLVEPLQRGADWWLDLRFNGRHQTPPWALQPAAQLKRTPSRASR